MPPQFSAHGPLFSPADVNLPRSERRHPALQPRPNRRTQRPNPATSQAYQATRLLRLWCMPRRANSAELLRRERAFARRLTSRRWHCSGRESPRPPPSSSSNSSRSVGLIGRMVRPFPSCPAIHPVERLPACRHSIGKAGLLCKRLAALPARASIAFEAHLVSNFFRQLSNTLPSASPGPHHLLTPIAMPGL